MNPNFFFFLQDLKHLMPRCLSRKLQGFSLLEVAIVLCIMGIFAGFGIPAWTQWIYHQRLRTTENHLDAVTQSLAAYVLSHKRLPCPADPTQDSERGIAAVFCTPLQGTIGIVPYKTLGLSERIAKDGQKNWITYAVSPSLTSCDIKFLHKTTDFSCKENTFCFIDTPFLEVVDEHKISVLNEEEENLSARDIIAFVLVSHGPSGGGSFDLRGIRRLPQDTDKRINADSSPLFVDRSLYHSFDDHVRWVTRNNLMAIYARNPCRE